MKRFGKLAGYFMAALVLCLAGAVTAAQVSSDSWLRSGSQYGRSDGLFQNRNNNTLVPFINGVQSGPALTKGFYLDFSQFGALSHKTYQEDLTATVLDDEVNNLFVTPLGQKINFTQIEDATIGPLMAAGSIDIACDQTNDEGIELTMMQYGASGAAGDAQVGFFVGDDAAFFTCATVAIEDVSGADDFHVGFRLAGAVNDAFDDYNTASTLAILAGDVNIETIINGAATVTTDIPLDYADAGTAKEYCVYVSAAGVSSFKVDGVTYSPSATHTFDDNDELVPFIYNIQAATLSGDLDITNWEAGYQ